MYQYTDFDRHFVRQRAAQFRDQLERWQKGKLSEDEFRPLRGCRTAGMCSAMRRCCAWPCPTASCRARSCACWRDRARVRRAGGRGLPQGAGHAGPARHAEAADPLRALLDAAERAVQLDSAGEVRRRDGPAGLGGHARHPDQRQLHPQHHQRRARRHRGRRSRRPAPLRRDHAPSGARCTRSSPSCRASSRSRSRAPPKTAPRPAGTTWA